MTIYFMIWALWGLLCAALAATKKHNVLIWLIVGVLLGPIAFVVLAFMANPQAAVDPTTTKLCSSCAESIMAAAKKCKHCGEPQEPVALAETIQAEYPLHEAVWQGDYSKVFNLINSGEKLHQENSEGATPLELAERREDQLIIKVLKDRMQREAAE